MARKDPQAGAGFESGLEEIGIREEVAAAAAIKAVIARQLAGEMKNRGMKASRAQIDRLLDPDKGSATVESLQQRSWIGKFWDASEDCGGFSRQEG
jgi:antitoxin HicB